MANGGPTRQSVSLLPAPLRAGDIKTLSGRGWVVKRKPGGYGHKTRLALGAGGAVRQDILEDRGCRMWGWDAVRVVNIQVLNAAAFKSVTGINPPIPAISFEEYTRLRFTVYAVNIGMSTPTIDTFLVAIAGFLRTKDAVQIQDYLRVEPPVPEIYLTLGAEVRQFYPPEFEESHLLEGKCSSLLPEFDDGPDPVEGGSWPGFVEFMKSYLEFWRDVNFENLVDTHELLSGLVNQCITALSNPTMGVVLLPVTKSLSVALSKLAIMLDKRPDLIAHLFQRQAFMGGDDDSAVKRTMVESTAELLQRAFTICLIDRTKSATERLAGKKTGIYTIANLVLKLLFQCGKTRLATQLFTNISQHSPPLSFYPASHRVTYLYYLGRFLFSNNQFLRGLTALQAAYDQCFPQCLKHRRHILIYLTTANIIVGRFPSVDILKRPEAAGLAQIFLPVCKAIARGDLVGFQDSLNGEHRPWFLKKGILLPLRNRCEIMVWRSLARKTFVLNGFRGDAKRAPTLNLQDVISLAQFLEERNPNKPAPYIDEDLEGGEDETPTVLTWTMVDVEAIICSLIEQGFMHGYISHKQKKFAIQRGKERGPGTAVRIGFPSVYGVISARAKTKGEEGYVPAWVGDSPRGGAAGAGTVVNLSGARPAGS
ncbi:hypothetical protein FGG08_004077 [Glutinoglossum americanum]|uniref:PCI domain-containing protein n=1 Tax=Glutinoglossum americanum TaxID=1670608 RepID=A0A9P8I6F4_9PEZI|nr:hypothetical protein FGG08_004077 [Glutinoglossum americanum]